MQYIGTIQPLARTGTGHHLLKIVQRCLSTCVSVLMHLSRMFTVLVTPVSVYRIRGTEPQSIAMQFCSQYCGNQWHWNMPRAELWSKWCERFLQWALGQRVSVILLLRPVAALPETETWKLRALERIVTDVYVKLNSTYLPNHQQPPLPAPSAAAPSATNGTALPGFQGSAAQTKPLTAHAASVPPIIARMNVNGNAG